MAFVITCIYRASEDYTFVITYDDTLKCYTNFCLKGKVSTKEAGKFLKKEQRKKDGERERVF